MTTKAAMVATALQASLATALVTMSLALAVSCGRGEAAAPAAVATGTAGVAAVSLPGNLAPGMAILVQGTGPVTGLPGLGPNVLPGLAGEYTYLPAGGAEPLLIRVWFTTVAIVVPPTWTAPSCPALPKGFSALAAPAAADGSLLWDIAAGSYHLIIAVPAAMESPCRFAATLAERFSFFHRYAERPQDVSFPATLELGR